MQVEPVSRGRWLEDLVPGDEVAIVAAGICPRIERVTSADDKHLTVLCGDARRYRRSTGACAGVDHAEHIEPVTQAHRDAIDRRDLVRWLRALPDQDPGLDALRAMRRSYDMARASQAFCDHLARVERDLLASAGVVLP